MPIVNRGRNLRVKVNHPTVEAVSIGLDNRTPGRFDGMHYGLKDNSELEIAMLVEGGLMQEPLEEFADYWDGCGVYAYVPIEKVNRWLYENGADEFVSRKEVE
jgi:hypothetical protein